MDIHNYLDRKQRLECELKKENFQRVVDEISKALIDNNFDITPTTMKEVIEHTVETILLKRKNLTTKSIKKEILESIRLDSQTEKEFNITWDYGVLEASRFIITTDKKYYMKSIKNPKAIPVFTPELLTSPTTKQNHHNEWDLKFYIFRIPVEE